MLSFDLQVNGYAGVDFNANENRDNYATSGEYRVVLPDGRTQVRNIIVV